MQSHLPHVRTFSCQPARRLPHARCPRTGPYVACRAGFGAYRVCEVSGSFARPERRASAHGGTAVRAGVKVPLWDHRGVPWFRRQCAPPLLVWYRIELRQNGGKARGWR
eukprot:366555-Chlamydomonas_euryale.AAC.31